jgi:DNA-binding MarR family transcriptional regulator
MTSDEYEGKSLQPIADIDPIIHSPTRLRILAYLSIVDSADFTYLLRQTELTRGNLSANLSKLEAVGYVGIQKEFVNKVPRTLIHLTDEGRAAIQTYRENMRRVLDELLGE